MAGDSSKKSPLLYGIHPMDESLEFIFTTMMNQGQVFDAVQFIRNIECRFIPTVNIIRTLIFEILMKNDHIKTLAFASDYLFNLIEVYPPINEERKTLYFDSIRNSHGFLADFWTVFKHIVDSYFIQREIYVFDSEGSFSHPTKYPNCKFLLEFFVKLLTEDFKHYNPDNSSSCLLMRLFWPNFDIHSICVSNRTDDLLKWINDIYATTFVNNMADLLESMHEMLNLVVRCIVEKRHNLSACTAFSSAPLAEIVDSVLNFSKDAFSNLSNVKSFLAFSELKYLRAKLSERIIKQTIKVSSRKYSVLTLEDIVEQCMFPSKLSKSKNHKPSIQEKKELRKRVDKKYFADMKMETTKLHELCRKNKFADLLEELSSSSEDINARDPSGNTPLHEACAVGSSLCVRHLIDEGFLGDNQTLDFAAFNLEGNTPLHIAVVNDHVEIAKMLLSNGGPELLNALNNKGQLPADLSSSDSMNKVIQEYDKLCTKDSAEPENEIPDDKDKSKENHGPAPVLKTFKEYSIYLEALNCLLCTYCDMFKLYRYVWQKDTVISSHSEKTCAHFTDENVCSEDAALILEMPALVETFMESIKKNALKSELHINIELIPLIGFAASLTTCENQ